MNYDWKREQEEAIAAGIQQADEDRAAGIVHTRPTTGIPLDPFEILADVESAQPAQED